MTETVELPQVGDPGTGLGDNWRVIVLNDNHNTFDGVAAALSTVLPDVSFEQGLAFANRIHTVGDAVVWSGHREVAEHYWTGLKRRGLTMAPLES
jgi:ATP-dependent Clp protease adaptor protein ClpS